MIKAGKWVIEEMLINGIKAYELDYYDEKLRQKYNMHWAYRILASSDDYEYLTPEDIKHYADNIRDDYLSLLGIEDGAIKPITDKQAKTLATALNKIIDELADN